MSKQTINIGASPNDGTGTPLRTSFDYTNQNFTELYTALGGGVGLPGASNQVIFNDGGTNLAGDSGLTFNKTTDTLSTARITTSGDAIVCSSTGDFYVGSTVTPQFKVERATGNATITGALTVDTNTLVVNAAGYADRVGIGTATPSTALNVVAGSSGINTTFDTPSAGDTRIELKNNGTRAGYVYWDTSEVRQFADSGRALTFYPNATLGMTLNSTGLGVGVTPSAWATFKGLQSGTASLAGYTGGADTLIGANVYFDGAFKYISANIASSYRQLNGVHEWNTAVTGSANAAIAFTQAMTLDASGNLLVGTTSASNQERLNLTSAVSLYVARVFNTASSGGNYGIAIRYSNAAPNNGSNEFLACSDSSASRAFIYSNGGIANYQANDSNLSDARTKTDIKPLTSYWNKIKALELVTFKYKDQTHSDDNIGLIAQQVESVAPEFVSNDGFGETPADGAPLKTIYSTDLYHAAIKALQEAMTRIEVLESKLA
jgi:hypothetical protein